MALEAFSDRRWFDSTRPHIARQRKIVVGAIERAWKLPMAPSEAFVDFRSVAGESITLAERMHGALGGFAFVSAVFAFVESKLWDDLKADGSIDAAARTSAVARRSS